MVGMRGILGCPPSQDASHHQDYYIFSRGSRAKPSFATVTGRGDNPSGIELLCFLALEVQPTKQGMVLRMIHGSQGFPILPCGKKNAPLGLPGYSILIYTRWCLKHLKATLWKCLLPLKLGEMIHQLRSMIFFSMTGGSTTNLEID